MTMPSTDTNAPLVLAVSIPGRVVAARVASHLGTHVASDRAALPGAFEAQRPIVAVGALGIWTRILAPHLTDKRLDPAVVVIDDAARFVIPLIGAHHGGNALAERIAEHLGATVVVTTGTDALGLPSPETLSELHGWTIDATRDGLLAVSAALVNNTPLLVFQDASDATAWRATLPPSARMVAAAPDLTSLDVPLLAVTDRVLPGIDAARDRVVLLRPRTLIAGIGASSGAPAEEIGALLGDALAGAGLARASIAGVATAEVKRDEPGILTVAAQLGVEVQCYSAAALASVAVPTPSAVVAVHVGTPSVAEAAALLRAGARTLLVEKRRSAHATVAIARIAQPELPA
jgi:cobalt-precorrin 5A hydrolase/precorrin-3B C17-methyltransferase